MTVLDRISLIIETATQDKAEESPEVVAPQKQSNPLVNLALMNTVHGPEALEKDITSLAQATKDSLSQFLAGKADITAVETLSNKLRDISMDISKSAAEVKAQVGTAPLDPETTKQLRLTRNRFARLPPKKQKELIDKASDPAFHDEVAGTDPETMRGKKKIAHHVASYALVKIRGGGYRVASEGERGRGILHVFKRGGAYIGFAVVDKVVTAEGVEALDVILNEASTTKQVLVHSSKSLEDILNIANYTKEVPNGKEVADNLNSKFGTEVKTLPVNVAKKVQNAAKPEPKPEPAPADPAAKPTIEDNPIYQKMLPVSKKLVNLSKSIDNEYISHAYTVAARDLVNFSDVDEVEPYIEMIKRRGDEHLDLADKSRNPEGNVQIGMELYGLANRIATALGMQPVAEDIARDIRRLLTINAIR